MARDARPKLDALRGGMIDDGLSMAGPSPSPPEGSAEGAALDPPPAAESLPETAAPEQDPEPRPRSSRSGAKAPARDRTEIATALDRRIALEKRTLYLPPEIADQIVDLSRAAGRLLGRRKVPEYLILTAGLATLPDPSDEAGIEALLAQLADRIEDFPPASRY